MARDHQNDSLKRPERFVKLPHAVIDHADLTAHQLIVYIVLLRYRNPMTGVCFPGLHTIADAARISRKTASRTIKALEEMGIIEVERVKAIGSKTNDSNKYKVALLAENPLKYLGKNAQGQRIPKRSTSRDSESLPKTAKPSSRDSESPSRDSQSLLVGTPSPTKKNKLKKINEEDTNHPLTQRLVDRFPIENEAIQLENNLATDEQVNYLKRLASKVALREGFTTEPDELTIARWRKQTMKEADELIQKYREQLSA